VLHVGMVYASVRQRPRAAKLLGQAVQAVEKNRRTPRGARVSGRASALLGVPGAAWYFTSCREAAPFTTAGGEAHEKSRCRPRHKAHAGTKYSQQDASLSGELVSLGRRAIDPLPNTAQHWTFWSLWVDALLSLCYLSGTTSVARSAFSELEGGNTRTTHAVPLSPCLYTVCSPVWPKAPATTFARRAEAAPGRILRLGRVESGTRGDVGGFCAGGGICTGRTYGGGGGVRGGGFVLGPGGGLGLPLLLLEVTLATCTP